MITPSWSKNTALICDMLSPFNHEGHKGAQRILFLYFVSLCPLWLDYFFIPKNSRTKSTKRRFSSFVPMVTRNQPSLPYLLLSPRRITPLDSAKANTSLPVLPVPPQSKRT